MSSNNVVQVAVPAPLYTCFDYKLPANIPIESIHIGSRVRVPFGRRHLTGVIMATSDSSQFDDSRLKAITELIDEQPVISKTLIELLQWSASYYVHPIGEVVQTALPSVLRQGKTAKPLKQKAWSVSDKAILEDVLTEIRRAPKQAQIYQLIYDNAGAMNEAELDANNSNWRTAIKALVEKSLLNPFEIPAYVELTSTADTVPKLNDEQQKALDDIQNHSGSHIHLLHGITGSGKTEVYLHLSQKVLSEKKQILILVPEIGLTPQLTDRFTRRLKVPTVVLHSGMTDNQRYAAWYEASTGNARLVIGTRSAVFTPMPDLGLIIVDEEHDGSYKQQDSFRYNARDLAIVRAQKENKKQTLPVVLGSATPSLESLNNALNKRYQLHRLTQRARNSNTPKLELIDLRKQSLIEGLSASLIDQMKRHLKDGNQVLLFLNRRGFSPLLMCHECGWTTHCKRCDAHMTYHKHRAKLHCHHCGSETKVPENCDDCSSNELLALGSGTERIEEYLKTAFPDYPVNRIDRDTTRLKGSLEAKLAQAHQGEAGILLGTQMLAKGHDFPNVTMVGVLDADQALYSNDFRATEHLAQLITQVAGRAGRANKPGEVAIQTHHPDHPLLQTLLHHGYTQFALQALKEREQANLPPESYLALLRCEAIDADNGLAFMQEARDLCIQNKNDATELFGPMSAPMEKRAGRYRTQIMLQSSQRKSLHQCLLQTLPQLQKLKSARQVRWSLDVDPYDTY